MIDVCGLYSSDEYQNGHLYLTHIINMELFYANT